MMLPLWQRQDKRRKSTLDCQKRTHTRHIVNSPQKMEATERSCLYMYLLSCVHHDLGMMHICSRGSTNPILYIYVVTGARRKRKRVARSTEFFYTHQTRLPPFAIQFGPGISLNHTFGTHLHGRSVQVTYWLIFPTALYPAQVKNSEFL